MTNANEILIARRAEFRALLTSVTVGELFEEAHAHLAILADPTEDRVEFGARFAAIEAEIVRRNLSTDWNLAVLDRAFSRR